MNEYMKMAVDLAKKAYESNDVPVGAIIVKNDVVIGTGYNRKNVDNVSVFHAEIVAIIDACKNLGNWHLDDCDIYVTLKPCEMCLNAIAESRIKNIYYLLDSDYESNLNSNYNNIKFNKIDCDNEYNKLLKTFFINKR